MKNGLFWFILFVVVALPVYLWFQSIYPVNNLSLNLWLKSIGQVSAIIGTVLLSLNFVLATRWRWVEALTSGINRAYIIHHIIGAASLIFLLIHPVFLSLQYISLSVEAAARFFVPSIADYAVWLGIFALGLMVLSLMFSFFITIAYEKWRLSHRILGITLLLASGHILFIPGNLDQTSILRWYLLGFLALGHLAFLYRSVLWRWLVVRHRYEVNQIIRRGDDVIEIFAKAKQKAIQFKPGQFMFVTFPKSKGVQNEPHPFSITGLKGDFVSFAAKSLGDFTETLKLVKKDAEILVEGPYGQFLTALDRTRPQIWIAGGIGITPFLSVIQQNLPTNYPPVTLYYVVSKSNEAVFADELRSLCTRQISLKFVCHVSEAKGRITADLIAYEQPDFLRSEFFICGPPPMMSSLRSQLRKLKVKNRLIHTEEFSLS